jgi:hypothetical protein
MSYLLTYMMSSFNPLSVGGAEPTPQSLDNMLSQGNIATDNSLQNIDGGTYASTISNVNSSESYPYIHSTSQGGYVTLGDYPQSSVFLPYVKVGYNEGAEEQVTIKPEGIEILESSSKNTLRNFGDKTLYAGQTYQLPSVNGQLQVQETPIVAFNFSDLETDYTPIIKQNTTYEMGGSLTVGDGNIILDDDISEQIRVYFIFNFSGGNRIYFISPTLDIFTNWDDASVQTDQAVMMMRYGSRFYLKRISFPL